MYGQRRGNCRPAANRTVVGRAVGPFRNDDARLSVEAARFAPSYVAAASRAAVPEMIPWNDCLGEIQGAASGR